MAHNLNGDIEAQNKSASGRINPYGKAAGFKIRVGLEEVPANNQYPRGATVAQR
ncbi:hypothetical protein TMEN_2228 [Trichophyton mentagrophytes]|nr:hypothetical protein TMEN_2228 [Trichophyton mentagrophytes]